jgi:predicted flap endonuclease-1-like 5' DNA nuclease
MAGLSNIELGVIGALIVLALLIAWWIMRRPAERVRAETVDVLTPGAAPAARNSLLVDALPVVPPPLASDALGGMGEVVAAAAADSQVSRDEQADDLTRIKGLGPKLARLLHEFGVTRFEQIAAWNEADIARIDAQLGTFQGRIARDNWVEQARYLAAGDVSGFEARFGKV